MPMAAFVIVVMALLAAAMGRIGSQSAMSVVQEKLSLQAFYAAESGAQLAMTRLIYPDADPAVVAPACTSLNGSVLTLNAPGLQGCEVRHQCAQPEAGFFTIISIGECRQGNLFATRSIEVATVVE